MSVFVAAVATESGVPLFSRKRGACEGIQFSTMASLHGINMFSKCHDVSILNTDVPNGSVKWKEFGKSITLIALATGGLECELSLLLSCVYDAMIMSVGKEELLNFKNCEQLKRELRPSLLLVESLMESLETASGSRPTLLLQLTECILCPEAVQLQRTLEQYREAVGGRYACLTVHGRLAATSADWSTLDPREARLLLLLSCQPGAPLRETCIFLPYTSPDVAFRAVTCKLLGDVQVQVVCGAAPALAQLDAVVLRCWENAAQLLRDAKRTHPRNVPLSLQLESGVLGILIVNVTARKCVSSRSVHAASQKSRAMSGAHRLDVLRTFFVRAARSLAPELAAEEGQLDQCDADLNESLVETYWRAEYHVCHARRLGELLCCALYVASLPPHTVRVITTQILNDFTANKEIFW